MLVTGFPTGALQANCYVLAPGPGGPCVVVDPGQDSAAPLAELLAEHELELVAVLLTHGHFDHVFDATPVSATAGVPVWIHADDRVLLSDPLRGLSAESVAYFGGQLELTEPADVHEYDDGDELDLAGLRFTVVHAPGHTRGSVLLCTATPDGTPVVCSGDVLFAGSIGRTDLPGGDHGAMIESLRTKVLALDDAAVVLPGHGPATTMAQERAANPYLRALHGGAAADPGSAR